VDSFPNKQLTPPRRLRYRHGGVRIIGPGKRIKASYVEATKIITKSGETKSQKINSEGQNQRRARKFGLEAVRLEA